MECEINTLTTAESIFTIATVIINTFVYIIVVYLCMVNATHVYR